MSGEGQIRPPRQNPEDALPRRVTLRFLTVGWGRRSFNSQQLFRHRAPVRHRLPAKRRYATARPAKQGRGLRNTSALPRAVHTEGAGYGPMRHAPKLTLRHSRLKARVKTSWDAPA